MAKYLNILLFLISFTTSASAIDVDSLLLKSIGGEKGLQSIKNCQSLYMSGSASMGFMKGQFTQITDFPNNFYISIAFAGFSIEQGYDGSTAWQTDMNGKRSKVTGHEEKELLKSLYLSSFEYILQKSDTVNIEYSGITEFNNTSCHMVTMVFPGSDTLFTYYNIETGLREGFISKYDMMEATTIESNYKIYNDFPVATSLTSKIEPVNFTISMTIDSITLNANIDKSKFAFNRQSKIDYLFPGHKQTETIGLKYVNGHIQIPVIINGHKKVWMILDSGAAANIFNKPVVEDLALETIGTLPAMGVAGFEDVELMQTDSIEIGNLKLYQQVAGKMDLSQIASESDNSENFGGIIGYDFLSRFPILIDYKNKLLTVFDPKTFRADSGGVDIDFNLSMQIPTVKAKINGIEGDFIVDLGNAIGLILHSHYVNSNLLEEQLETVDDVRNSVGGIGGIVKSRSAVAKSFEIGLIQIDSIPVILPEMQNGITKSEQIAGNIGNPVLENYKVLFDYKNSKIYLYPLE